MIKKPDWPFNFTRRLFRYRKDHPEAKGLEDRVNEVLGSLPYQKGANVIKLYFKEGNTYAQIAELTFNAGGAKEIQRIMNETLSMIQIHDQFIGVIRGDKDTVKEFIDSKYPDKRKLPIRMLDTLDRKIYNCIMRYLLKYRNIENPTVNDVIWIIKRDYLQGVPGIGPFFEKELILYIKGLGFTDEDLSKI